ncbi:hypothetical protein [Planctomycetes bacterium Poly30]|uniref:hypothetical protein n=1 Tax=Saltatorellus ferox TaxID=2528018 RepID=UPI00119FB1B0
MRAICVAGLVTAATAAAQEAPRVGDRIVGQAIEASSAARNAGGGNAPVVRWDGQAISQDDEVRGLKGTSRRTLEAWRRFAERRGYRVDLDASQRVIVISDAERFESFASSERVVERVMEQLEELGATSDAAPLVLLRASTTEDVEDAKKGASLLGLGHRLEVFEETGTLRDVRAVNARLAESVARAHLNDHQPYLSEWMVDGIASLVAEEATGRAIIDGKAVSLRTVLGSVSKAHKHDQQHTIDLLKISGAGSDDGPMEAEAMAVMSFLGEEILHTIVPELGQRDVSQASSKVRVEEEALLSHMGKTALQDLQRSLMRGK